MVANKGPVLWLFFQLQCEQGHLQDLLFLLECQFFMGLVGRQLLVTKQAEIGQGTQKLLSPENIIYIKLSVTKTGADAS